MPVKPVITLTTDFGDKDSFVGILKGVILQTNPDATIIDISHGIRSHDIREAALTFGMSFAYFPKNTIHVVVVDPGVGSERRPIIVRADQYYFVGPDNGVFSYIYSRKHESLQVIHITSEHYFISAKGSTFHARDIFAPTAAYLSRGINILNFGEEIEDYIKIPLPFPQKTADNSIRGEVILIDRFGNAITNIRDSHIKALCRNTPDCNVQILMKDTRVTTLDYYAQATDKGLYAVVNSSGYLELFVFRGHAASEHTISIGDEVEISVTV
jgi:S-adenosylmethionine hydrolase